MMEDIGNSLSELLDAKIVVIPQKQKYFIMLDENTSEYTTLISIWFNGDSIKGVYKDEEAMKTHKDMVYKILEEMGL
jgi:hypothetical protein